MTYKEMTWYSDRKYNSCREVELNGGLNTAAIETRLSLHVRELNCLPCAMYVSAAV
jgi:hypothetical protein